MRGIKTRVYVTLKGCYDYEPYTNMFIEDRTSSQIYSPTGYQQATQALFYIGI